VNARPGSRAGTPRPRRRFAKRASHRPGRPAPIGPTAPEDSAHDSHHRAGEEKAGDRDRGRRRQSSNPGAGLPSAVGGFTMNMFRIRMFRAELTSRRRRASQRAGRRKIFRRDEPEHQAKQEERGGTTAGNESQGDALQPDAPHRDRVGKAETTIGPTVGARSWRISSVMDVVSVRGLRVIGRPDRRCDSVSVTVCKNRG